MADARWRSGIVKAATAMPVIEGALAFIVITFVATVWESVPLDRQHAAFVIIYASGAHFLFSFLLSVPVMFIGGGTTSRAVQLALALGLFGYVFWSLNEQHQGLANLLLSAPWRIPLPLGEEISSLMRRVAGGPANSMFFSPLIFGYAFAAIWVIPFWIFERLSSRSAGPAPDAP